MKRIGISIAMAIGILAAANTYETPTAAAQTSTTGAVRGRVIDRATKEAVIGATVVATGPALPGQQAEISDESGNFQIANLPPGVYVLTVYYNEAQFSRPNVLIELGKQAFVNIPIDTSVQTAEVIELEGRAPIVDQGSTKTGTTITDEYTTRIPVGRTFGAVLGTAAGTQGDQYGISFGGSTSAENTYIVEGINTTDTAYGLQSSNLPNEFIEETEVIAGGYNAEFGRSTGGVINVVTKTGSNKFGGSVFGYYTPGGLIAEAEPIVRSGTAISSETNVDYRTDVGFELGGPIVKDKFWFHVGYNPSFTKSTLSRITSTRVDDNNDGAPDVDPATDTEVFREVSRNDMSVSSQTHFFTGKINGALTQDHQFQISAFGNPRTVPRDFLRVTASRDAQLYKHDEGAYDAAAKWTSKFAENKTQVDVVAGYHLGYEHESPYFADGLDSKLISFQWNRSLSDLRGFESNMYSEACNDGTADDRYPMFANCPIPGSTGYGTNGLGGAMQQRDNARLSANVSLTQRVKLAGHHTFKLGLDGEQTGYDNRFYYTGGGIWIQRVGTFSGVPDAAEPGHWDERNFLVVEEGLDPMDPNARPCIGNFALRDYSATCRVRGSEGYTADTKNLNLAAYVQDSWQIRPNLTLNAGLRWEQQTGYTASEVQGQTTPEGEVIPDVAYELGNQWAPRLGLIYDPTQEGRAKLFTHWGRFYETVPMDINVRAFGGEIINFDRVTTRAGTGAPGGTCPQALMTSDPAVLDACPIATPSRRQFGGGTEYVAPSMGGQYIDELLLGAEYELMPDFKMGLNYVNRNLGRAIEDLSTDGGSTYFIANPGEDFSGDAADLRREAEQLRAQGMEDLAKLAEDRAALLEEVEKFDKPQRDYQAIQITANQRFSKSTMVIASYTYSRSKGNFPGLFSTETGQLDPNLTSMYDLPELMANRYGPLGLDRPHLLKVDGFRQFDLKKAGLVILGASFRGESGIAHNTLGSHIAYGGDESYILPRGAAPRSPFNWNVDIKATYGYKVSKTSALEAFVDIFNLFNKQDEADADERYTRDVINPIVGGDLADLPHAKVLNEGTGLDANAAPTENPNYLNTNARQAPLSVRLGLRYTF